MIFPDRIDTVLLYDTDAEVDAAALLLDINASIPSGKTPFGLRMAHGGNYALLENDIYHVSIRKNPKAQPAEEFTRALDAPITQAGRVKFLPRIRRHDQAIFISVGLGSLSENRGEQPVDQGFADRGAAPLQLRDMIALSHALTRCLVRQTPPLAIHWRQSNRLLIPEQVMDHAETNIPVSYCYSPAPFSSGTKQKGRYQSGLRAIGSEHILGRTLVLHESSLSLTNECNLVDAVLRLALSEEIEFRDGQRMAIDNWPTFELRRRPPSEAFPCGTLELLIDEDDRPMTHQRDSLREAFGRKPARDSWHGRAASLATLDFLRSIFARYA